jgi:hypothetical protein
MSSQLLCDWTTVRAGGPISIAQGETEWVDLGDDVDATFWVDCREVSTNPNVQLLFETSPSKDEALFQPITPAITLAASGTPIQVRSVLASATVPLARWLRWRLTGPSGGFDATFRIGMTGTPFSYFLPTQLAGLVLWLRADLGVTLATAPKISGWTDQSGVSAPNNFSQATVNSQPTLVTSGTGTVGGLPAIKFVAGTPNQFIASTAGNTYTQPNSVFIVWQEAATGLYNITDAASASANRQQIETVAGVSTTLTLNAGAAQNVTGVPSYLNPSLVEVDWNGASSALYVNGTLQTAPGNVGANSWSPGTLGASQTGTQGLNGSIAEVVAFNKILSATDRTRLARYLGGRYGITVP